MFSKTRETYQILIGKKKMPERVATFVHAQGGMGFLFCPVCKERVPITYLWPDKPDNWRVLHWFGHRVWRRK